MKEHKNYLSLEQLESRDVPSALSPTHVPGIGLSPVPAEMVSLNVAKITTSMTHLDVPGILRHRILS
jgi:hypothetical protein